MTAERPLDVIEASPNPAGALASFVAEKLEQWDFQIVDVRGSGLLVRAGGVELMVGIQVVR